MNVQKTISKGIIVLLPTNHSFNRLCKKKTDSILYLLLTDLILMVNSFYIVLFMFFLAMTYLVGEVSF